MSTDISLEVIHLTQENLGKFVKKPPLTEKLLKKPPFRFLHDIVTTVIRNTGFFDGLFSDEELVSENVKDRDSKIAFLQKVIEVVNIVTESSLAVRPSKVIAGLEPEKTNELLQKISYALQQNLSSIEAVEMVTASKKIKKPAKTTPVIEKNNQIEPNNKPSKTLKSNVSNKQKTTVPVADRKISKEKPKLEINNTLAKGQPKPKKNDIPKKTIETASKLLKSNGDIKKTVKKKSETNDNNSQSSAVIPNESERTEPFGVLGKVVELKDIEDSDDENENQEKSADKSEPTLNQGQIISPTDEPVYALTESTNIPPPIKTLTESTNIHSPIKSLNESTNIRPRSRISRQQSGRQHPEETSNISFEVKDGTNKNIVESQFGENIAEQNSNENKEKSEKSEVSELKTEPIEIKKPIIRTASSNKRSAKIKPEVLQNTQSISIESRSDGDTLEQKSFSSNDSESKTQSRPKTSLRPPSVRPSSARPGAPRLKERNTDVIITTTEPVLIGKVNVIVENYDNQPEDDEGGVEVMQVIADDIVSNSESGDSKTDIISSGHGHLVQQILETQKELAHGDAPKVEIEWEWGARKEREASYKEIENIRSGLQSLSRASNPLGKLMDYIQEDVEVMRQELIQWRDARLSAAAELKHQQNLTEQQIQPLLAKLKQLQDNIVEQTESVHTVKSNIHRNAQKILKLIDGDDYNDT